jgi:hypothetical protein
MTENISLQLSLQFEKALRTNLTSGFQHDFPMSEVTNYVNTVMKGKVRNTVYTLANTLFIMLLTATQEDKSLQHSVDIFKHMYESQSAHIRSMEAEALEKEKHADMLGGKKSGRPKKYKSKLSKSITNEVKTQTVAYSNARKRLPMDLINSVYNKSKDFGEFDNESWHGMRTYITDGTYLQLQDTEDIKGEYPIMKENGAYPQALLQIIVRQGSGQIWDYALGNRTMSELELVVPMFNGMELGYLLLADALYNCYYHFWLILKNKAHMIVPGKRERNYTVIKKITDKDLIVKITKGRRPAYVNKKEWDMVSESLILRRITYEYPTKNGMETSVLYTTITDENIDAVSIVQKYEKRWDIEISIREIKTLMDINVLRSKSCDMLKKELEVALTAYNMVRKIMARAADKAAFPPESNIFQKRAEAGSHVFLDKRGRVFCRVSTGRPRKT